MTHGTHARPAQQPARRPRRGSRWWRLGTPLVVLLSGSLFVVSAQNSDGTDLRPGRYTDLASLVGNESDRYDALQTRVAGLTADVADLTGRLSDRDVDRLRRKVDRLKDPAGLTRRQGPGVTVTLSDAPEDVQLSTTQNPNLLVVHQQDIQAVVNAMWAGGAAAVTVQGQRIVSTTGIKCEGNVVTLQGQPYAQPYVISAVGDVDELTDAIADNSYLANYREQSDVSDIAIGWGFAQEDDVVAPAYDGLLDLNYATPLP